MEIINSLDNFRINEKTAVALGNFDGLHIGHQVVMKDAVRTAAENGMRSVCFTFSNHPFNFILRRSDDDPDAVKMICTEEEKRELVRNLGFDILVSIPFDETVMKMRASEFFDDIIAGRLFAGYISVGFNYTYGARAEGKADMLIRQCSEAGIGITVHDAVISDGQVVSSTLIREMISNGDMEQTAKALGRPYSFTGIVSHGRRIGSSMGIPTVNIPLPACKMLPPNGVYFSRILVDGTMYSAVSNLGINPTVSDTGEMRVETNIFEFDRDIYDSQVTVFFDYFSRGERKFGSKEELFEQINRDCEEAVNYRKKI